MWNHITILTGLAESARCNIRKLRKIGFALLICALSGLAPGSVWQREPLAAARTRSASGPVYAAQPAVRGPELSRFLEILPQFRAFVRQEGEEAHPVVRNGKADFLYSPKTAAWLESHGWNARRFFCVMGRMAAALAIIEEGNDLGANLPRDMPAVSKEELSLARRNLDALLRVGGAPAAPIRH